MRHIHRDMDATYGTRRMMVELRELGFNVGRYKVRQLMKRLKLVAKRPKQHRYPIRQGSDRSLGRSETPAL